MYPSLMVPNDLQKYLESKLKQQHWYCPGTKVQGKRNVFYISRRKEHICHNPHDMKPLLFTTNFQGFPHSSDGKEFAGDLGSIPGLVRSPGKGKGYPLQCSCLENPMDRGAWWDTVHGVPKSRT